MTTTLSKYPFPTPRTGVMRNVHPRELGFNGLTYAKNWIRRNGVFQTRDGLSMFSPQLDSHTPEAEIILGLYQYDYQFEGIYYSDGNPLTGSPSKDSLVAVTDVACYCKTPAQTAWQLAEETTEDTATVLVGPNAVTEELWDYTDKVEISLSTVNWADIAAGLGVTVASLQWITVEIYVDSSGYHHRIWDHASPINDIVGANTGITPGKLEELVYGGDGLGIHVTFNDDNFDDELAIWGEPPVPTIWYTARIWRGAHASNAASVIEGLRDDAEVMRSWDYGQNTHVLIASPSHYVADMTMYDDASAEPTVRISGGFATSPYAKAIGIAGQRVVAGNVAFMDQVAFLEDNGYTGNADRFAYYPDGIVYSGTVLDDGHNRWYQEYLIRLADTPGAITAHLEMGTMMLAVYKTDAIYVLAVQTGTEPFRPDLRASGIQGPVGPMAVTALSDNLHVYLGRDGALYFFDGSPPRSLGPHVQEWLAKDLDVDYAHRSFLVWNSEKRELRVWYPAKGHAGRVRCGLVIGFDDEAQPAWPIEYDTHTAVIGEAPPTKTCDWDMTCALAAYVDAIAVPGEMLSMSGGSTEALGTLTIRQKRMLLCHALGSGTLYPDILYEDPNNGDTYSTNNGATAIHSIVTSFRTGATDFESPDRLKVLTEVELILDTSNVDGSALIDDMTVTLWKGSQDTILEHAAHVSVDTTAGDPYFAEFREEGRFFALECSLQTKARRVFGGAFAALKARGRPR